MSGIVFVGEDFDDEPGWESGRWSTHWESDDGGVFRSGPEGVSLTEAISWGRRQASIVLVRPGDSDIHYSAGTRRPEPDDDGDYPEWPEGQELPRRPSARPTASVLNGVYERPYWSDLSDDEIEALVLERAAAMGAELRVARKSNERWIASFVAPSIRYPPECDGPTRRLALAGLLVIDDANRSR